MNEAEKVLVYFLYVVKMLLLLASVFLGACATRPTTTSSNVVVHGGPSKTVQRGASSIMVYVPDSVERTYTKLLDELKQGGYPLPTLSHKATGLAVSFSTLPKTIANVAGLSLQVVVDPVANGSMVTFMGKYVPVDAQGQAARDSRRWRWINYGVPDTDLPTQAFWEDMNRVALASFPGARVEYF